MKLCTHSHKTGRPATHRITKNYRKAEQNYYYYNFFNYKLQ